MEFYDKHKRVSFSPDGELCLIQRFHGDGHARPPICDVADCKSQAVAMYSDKTHKAFCVCWGCNRKGSEEGLFAELQPLKGGDRSYFAYEEREGIAIRQLA